MRALLLPLLAAACASRPPPATAAGALPRSGALFRECERRLDAFQVRNLRGARSAGEAVDAESNLLPEQRRELRPLADEGVALAEAWLREHPEDPEGLRCLALNLAMAAAARGTAAALFEGYPARLSRTIDRGLAIAPDHDGGVFHAVRGKFLSTAPWPVRDLERADRALGEALARTPSPRHLLFLGDLRHRQGRPEEARAAWAKAASEAPAGDGAGALARLRLRLASPDS